MFYKRGDYESVDDNHLLCYVPKNQEKIKNPDHVGLILGCNHGYGLSKFNPLLSKVTVQMQSVTNSHT